MNKMSKFQEIFIDLHCTLLFMGTRVLPVLICEYMQSYYFFLFGQPIRTPRKKKFIFPFKYKLTRVRNAIFQQEGLDNR